MGCLLVIQKEIVLQQHSSPPIQNTHEAAARLMAATNIIWKSVCDREYDESSLPYELADLAAMACRVLLELDLMDQLIESFNKACTCSGCEEHDEVS